MLQVSNESCYRHAKYLEYLYTSNDTQELLIEANTAIKYLTSFDMNKYTDMSNMKLVVLSYILLPLVYTGFITKSILDKFVNINTKFDIQMILNNII